MFLAALKKQNPKLIEVSLQLSQEQKVLPDSYIIDVDQLLSNAELLLKKASQYGIKLYAMTKQIGRNPWLCKKLLDLGYQGIVAVDFKEVRQLYHHHIPVAHIGHLVQPPSAMLKEILRNRPEVITLYSLEKAQEINDVAKTLGLVQPLLIKVFQEGDILYPSQESGIALSALPELVKQINSLSHVKVIGATHFPCCLFQNNQTQLTHNFKTLLQGIDILKQQGIDVSQINAPSATSCETLPLLAQYGVTHAEPGHALTGTTPANQFGEQPEKIAMLYLSEISHSFKNQSYFYGGGYYPRGHLTHALVSEQGELIDASVGNIPADNIDYTLPLSGRFQVGSPVISCFRTQIFVTRSDVVLVKGIQSGNPQIINIYTSLGDLISHG